MSFKETRAVMAGLLAMARLTGDEPTVRQAMEAEMAFMGGGSAPLLNPKQDPVHCSYCTVIGVDELKNKLAVMEGNFKAFHLGLSRRFGYVHDEKDWQRDLLSLEEHIAKQVSGAGNWQALAARGVRDGVHPELASELLAIGWRNPMTIDGPATKTVRYDLSVFEVEGELRDKLVEMGWTPPGDPPIEICRSCFSVIDATAAGAAAREAYDNTFHKVRAEVSFDWWGRIWLKALVWAGHAPRSLEETDLEILRKSDARIGGFERLLEDIGIVREDDALHLTLRDAGAEESWRVGRWGADSQGARSIAFWMMRKQALLSGESWPGQVEAAAAWITAPNDEQTLRLTGEVSSDDRNAETANLRIPDIFFRGTQFVADGVDGPAWFRWDGGERHELWVATGSPWPKCPVTPGTRVMIRFRDGEERETDRPELMRWAWTRKYVANADIMAYRILH